MSDIASIHSLDSGFEEENLRTPALSISRYIKKIEYFMDIKPNQTIIDFGCGDGAVTIGLAKKYPNSRFIGIDYSEDLIGFAKNNNGLSNVEYISANLIKETISLDENSIDGIFSWEVMYYTHPKIEYSRYQSEFYRLLKEKGIICHFQIPLRYACLFSRIEFKKRTAKEFLKNIAKCVRDIFSYQYNEYAYRYSKRDLIIMKNKFDNIQLVQDDFFIGRVSVIYKK